MNSSRILLIEPLSDSLGPKFIAKLQSSNLNFLISHLQSLQ